MFQVARLCKERMHIILAEELRLAEAEMLVGEVEVSAESINAALVKCFSRMDELVLSSCTCGSVGETCRCEQRGMAADVVGSTAVVALVDRQHIIVANCGDSRAVLGNNGISVLLSEDHKPDRVDELARIEEAGGRVVFLNGARVHGILAMSRALGDKYLKPWVISEPEMTVTRRTPEDEFLVIASDGLWDVVPSGFACDATRRCIKEVMEAGGAANFPPLSIQSVVGAHPPDSHCAIAASTLARLALARHSSDNISVIVVDLKQR
ncbi:hypothetical protein Taro_031326 [Colocasia esculenta]|uniref:protein-serine/threonine phosphatase n=1 Tax=Colocasia esculenta TaxID=4460 RepID=A0A843W0K9_COLES|nr:hypothetical protein [Colocasia esculenta]